MEKRSISSFQDLTSYLKSGHRKTKIAVANGEDRNTLGALARAVNEGFIAGILLGPKDRIGQACRNEQIDPLLFTIIDYDPDNAVREAVRMVKSGEADVLMKGLIGTDKFLKAVLDKEKGLLLPKTVMSYVCALEIPKYHKLLFITDPAVIPVPDLDQKIAMTNYAVNMANRFGIDRPKVALISGTEKVNHALPSTIYDALICKMVNRGQMKDCIIDGPLDVFLACDKEKGAIKGVETPVAGDADILVFPNIESANSFYKGLMVWAGAELAGLIQGTIKPVIVMSRSESAASKYYCIALSCLMAEEM
ncbi:MAG: phosphate acyltransferase [Candidatus Cloacimonetes bacterium]|nr:phosphate acyltransferase [Candidatus Cloacimonadota bacterium]